MESLSMVSHTNALIKNRETIDINLYEQFIKYLDASPKLKVSNAMLWVQKMNNIRNKVSEIINAEVIFPE